MKRLLKYLKSYKKECVLGPLFKMFEATLELIVPLVIAVIIDKGIGTESVSSVVKASMFLLLLGAIGLAFSLTAQYFSAKAAVGFVAKLRYALFEKIGTLSYSDIDELGTSTLITRMTQDASKVQNGLNLALRLLLRSPFVVFGAMIMAFTVDAKSALTFAAVIPLLSIVVFGIMLITMPLYKRAQKGTDRLLSKTRENLAGARVIRAFGNEDEEIDAFKKDNDALTLIQRRVGKISALMNPLTYVLINVAILFLINTGAIQVSMGNLTQGEVVALYNYMSQILVELIKLANLIISITKALASASRIADMLDIQSTENMGTLTTGKNTDVSVEFRNASLTYSGSAEPSLEALSFTAKKGETIGIIGGYGGGRGAVMQADPLYRCWDHIREITGNEHPHTIFLSPCGRTFNQDIARELKANYDHIVLVCGHYEGIDQRFIDECVDEEISVGDFVLTGGEIPAMAICDAVCRMVPGVLPDEECFTEESHWNGLLEYPQYSHPSEWHGRKVPDVLLSGHHANIAAWRKKESYKRTMLRRPDMFAKFDESQLTTKAERKILQQAKDEFRALQESTADSDN